MVMTATTATTYLEFVGLRVDDRDGVVVADEPDVRGRDVLFRDEGGRGLSVEGLRANDLGDTRGIHGSKEGEMEQ